MHTCLPATHREQGQERNTTAFPTHLLPTSFSHLPFLCGHRFLVFPALSYLCYSFTPVTVYFLYFSLLLYLYSSFLSLGLTFAFPKPSLSLCFLLCLSLNFLICTCTHLYALPTYLSSLCVYFSPTHLSHITLSYIHTLVSFLLLHAALHLLWTLACYSHTSHLHAMPSHTYLCTFLPHHTVPSSSFLTTYLLSFSGTTSHLELFFTYSHLSPTTLSTCTQPLCFHTCVYFYTGAGLPPAACRHLIRIPR